MRTRELERLVWRRIDGDLSPEDANRLDRHLEDDPEARQRARRIEELARLLTSPPTAEPPQELRPRIDRALAAARAPWSPQPSPLRWTHTGQRLPRLAYLSAGVLLGVVATLLLLPGPRAGVDRDHAVAAMGNAAVDRVLELELGDGVGRLRLRRRDGVVGVDAILATDEEVRLTVVAAHGGLHLESVGHDQGTTGEVHAAGSELLGRIAGAGEHRLILRLDDSETAIEARVWGRGRLLAEGRIDGPGGGTAP